MLFWNKDSFANRFLSLLLLKGPVIKSKMTIKEKIDKFHNFLLQDFKKVDFRKCWCTKKKRAIVTLTLLRKVRLLTHVGFFFERGVINTARIQQVEQSFFK